MILAKLRKLWLVVLCALLSATVMAPAGTSAISGSSFDPGNIIDDVVFYDSSAMSLTQIADFLDSKVSSCDTNGSQDHSYYYDSSTGRVNHGGSWVTTSRAVYGQRYNADSQDWGLAYHSGDAVAPYTCLKDKVYSSTPSKSAESGTCKSISAKSNQSAAHIIYSIAKACGVSEKALIVLLQKEEGLVTDDWPWSSQYRIATGFACPDGAPCSSQYYGFFNQVYSAARQFKRYRQSPTSWSYVAGRTNSILYNPNTACGHKSVYIDNQATAGLYDYTPYVPNKAALDAGYGTGNSCSAYGNRNFWLYFNDWFGTTKGSVRFIECSGNKYLIERGIRKARLINADALTAWGLDDVNFVTGDKGCSYPVYSLQLGGGSDADSMVIRSRDSGALYLVDSSGAYHITNQSTANAWGITGGSHDYPQFYGDSIHLLKVIGRLPRVAKSSNSDKVYLMDEGKLHCINCTGASNSGVSNSTISIKLVNGNGNGDATAFSGNLLSDISGASGDSAHDTSLNIDHSFRAHTHWYYFDYGKTHLVKDSLIDRWDQYDSSLMDGPQLSMDLRHYLPYAPDLRKGYRYGSSYYMIDSGGGIHHTTSSGLAKNWGVYHEPYITSLLQRKL